jgi:hypothetical protein
VAVLQTQERWRKEQNFPCQSLQTFLNIIVYSLKGF